MKQRYKRPLTPLDVVFSAFTDPYGTMHHLLIERPKPPYVVLSLVFVLATVLLPPLVYRYRLEMVDPDVKLHYAAAITAAVTLVFFVVLSTIMLRLIGVAAPVVKVLAATVYTLVPIVPMMSGYYLGNYMSSGDLTLVKYLVTGIRPQSDIFIPYFSPLVKIALFFCWLVHVQALRVLGSMSFLTGMLVSGLSVGLLIVAGFAGLTVSQAIYPDTGHQVTQLFLGLLDVQ